MLNLFTEDIASTKKISIVSNPIIEKILYKQLDIFKDYMFYKDFFIDNKHPFVSILNNIIPSGVNDMSKIELSIYLKNNVEYLANVIGCTSNRNKGSYFKDGDLTYIVLLDNDDDVLNKKEYDIVEVLYTDYDVIDFSYSVKEEFMVIKLNPIELVLDYLEWEKQRLLNEEVVSYNIYVATRVIPKLWDTKMNLVIFNRLINLYYDIKNTPFKNKLPIQIINVENILDIDLKRILKFITNSIKLHSSTLLNSFIYLNKPLSKVLSFDNMTFTTNTSWIPWLTRIYYMNFLLDISSETDSDNTNNDVIKKLFIYIRRYNNRETTLMVLPKKLQIDFQINLDYLKEKIKYN